MVSKKFSQELDDYMGLINIRLCDISCAIEDLSMILTSLGKELSNINNKLKK